MAGEEKIEQGGCEETDDMRYAAEWDDDDVRGVKCEAE